MEIQAELRREIYFNLKAVGMVAHSRARNDVSHFNLPLPGLSMLIRLNRIRQQITTAFAFAKGEKQKSSEDETGRAQKITARNEKKGYLELRKQKEP